MQNEEERDTFASTWGIRSIKNKYVLAILMIFIYVWCLFQFIVAVYPIATNSLLAIHLSFGLSIGLLIFPMRKLTPGKNEDKYFILDVVLALLSIAPGVYILIFQEDIQMRFGFVTPLEYLLGTLLIVLVLELGRRVMGWIISLIGVLAILYAMYGFLIPGTLGHGGFSFGRIVNQLYLTTEGIYTLPIQVSATFVFLFILFGNTLQVIGAGDFFIKLASSLFGRFRGGPAKVSVFASMLFGMMSGSAVANVAVVGTLTIPLMKRIGFKPHIAAAIEAAGSNGGQFMPPIMGAAAFIIPSIIGGTYWDVVRAAFIPAFLYYLAIFLMVDLESAKMKLIGLRKEELPSLINTFKEGSFLLLPIAVLIYVLAYEQKSPNFAAFWAIVMSGIIALLSPSRRKNLKSMILNIAVSTARSALLVVAACAIGGIIIGCLLMTGLGMSLSAALLNYSHGSLVLLLMLTMIASLILGMGMTTTACYIILAVLVAPALTKMGVPPMAAHLFIFYFGIISSLTPPVALSAYAAAGIAGSDPTKTGYAGFKLGSAGFMLPYAFVFAPAMLLIEGTIMDTIVLIIASAIGIYFLSAGLQGYMFRSLGWEQRGLLVVGAGCLIFPGLITDIIGLILGLLVVVPEVVLRFKMKKVPNC
ncbi:MAG: TRAP transporter permease [Syntrophales bacterium]